MTARTTAPRTAAHRPILDPFAGAGAVLALGCTLVGTYVDTPWKAGSGEWGLDLDGTGGWGTLAALVAFVAVALVLVSLATARARAVPAEGTGRRALVLAALAVVTLVVFWTGVPPVLAGGAAGLASDVRRRTGSTPAPAAVALVLAVLTAAVAVWLAFTG